jgi:hypothetical protein
MRDLRRRFHLLATLSLSLMVVVGFGACSQKHSHIPPGDYISESQPATVRQLEAAKELDESDAIDPKLGVVAREDFLEQAGKADRAIKELNHGYAVSDTELEDALQVPPRGLSATEKSVLIKRVIQAEQATDHNEQAMLSEVSWGYSDQPAATSRFDQRKELDEEVVKDLTIGEDVHWDTIQEALRVVPNPY